MSHLPKTNGHKDQRLDDRPPQNPLIGALAGLSEAFLAILKVKKKIHVRITENKAMAKVVRTHVLHVSLPCSISVSGRMPWKQLLRWIWISQISVAKPVGHLPSDSSALSGSDPPAPSAVELSAAAPWACLWQRFLHSCLCAHQLGCPSEHAVLKIQKKK